MTSTKCKLQPPVQLPSDSEDNTPLGFFGYIESLLMSVTSQHAQLLALFGVLGVVSGAIIYFYTKSKKQARDEEIGVGLSGDAQLYTLEMNIDNAGVKTVGSTEGLTHRNVTSEAIPRKDSVKSKTLSAIVIGSPTVEVTSKLEFPTSSDKPLAPQHPPKVDNINEKAAEGTIKGSVAYTLQTQELKENEEKKELKKETFAHKVSDKETYEESTMIDQTSSKTLLEKASLEVSKVEQQVNNMAAEVARTVAEINSTLPKNVEEELRAYATEFEESIHKDGDNVINAKLNSVVADIESNLTKHASIESIKIEQTLNEILAKEMSPVQVKEEPIGTSSIKSTQKKLVKGNSLLEMFNAKHVNAIEDHFSSLKEISSAINMAGLEQSQLIFGIDFTISNLENGTNTFNGRSLHYCDESIRNPYQKVIEILGKTLETFDMDGRIPAFGFGDSKTKDRRVFPFSSEGSCLGFKDVLDKYNTVLKNIQLSGPTNFAPLIREAIKIVKTTKQYHILVIVADGQVTNERQTREAIVEASKYPISIIMVGVGDGPWDTMNEFDDSLPKRQFDNFQFVNYHEVTSGCENPDEMFALHTLMEIPDQYKAIKDLKLLD